MGVGCHTPERLDKKPGALLRTITKLREAVVRGRGGGEKVSGGQSGVSCRWVEL
jgi:hypothetical protein